MSAVISTSEVVEKRPAEGELQALVVVPRPHVIVERVDHHDLAALKAIKDLQEKIWNYPDCDIVPSFTLQALAEGCGQVLIAREGDKVVGFAFSYLRQDPKSGRLSFYLDLVGVDPQYQDRGIGRQLMEELKVDASRRGIDTIEWRYDGLETRNAKLYLGKLGARVIDFHPDTYGIHDDIQSDGLPTDRFFVRWDYKRASTLERFPYNVPAVICVDGNESPTIDRDVLNSKPLNISMPVPLHFQAVKDRSLALGREWINAFRECSSTLFADGYHIVSFRAGEAGYGEYLWSRSNVP